ncbi:hypothetical protein TanjilG_18247 [Lupinus angustifolius]|uniref:Uncharacterized protein n=1 Tax=Lupinus angustifolius TaxID=3871 RepID=A0A394DG12_LUPAN|nr:hypothetical protein TanjilG_18247 [Lupinus angustifolius]
MVADEDAFTVVHVPTVVLNSGSYSHGNGGRVSLDMIENLKQGRISVFEKLPPG